MMSCGVGQGGVVSGLIEEDAEDAEGLVVAAVYDRRSIRRLRAPTVIDCRYKRGRRVGCDELA